MKKFFKNIVCVFAGLMLCVVTVSAQDIVVAQDGSGNYKSIQDAINSLPAEATQQRVIVIKKGEYREKLFLEKNFITLRGENPEETKIIISQAREIFRCGNNDDWGVATINLKGSDINLENLSFINEYGFVTKDSVTVLCETDSVAKTKTVKKTSHQMALRSFTTTRLIVKNCIFRAGGGDTVSPWNTDDGMFYFKDCVMEGWVDMYCPRGWALADNCKFICHSKDAAIWHDGSKSERSKTVFFNCNFSGDEGFKLGRYHRDAQFYLLDCSFSKEMADADVYQKAANPPNVIQWGRRVYYYNCHRQGGDYAWHKNNLPPSLGINDITAAWAFDYKWKPADVKFAVSNDTYEKPVTTASSYDTVAENMLLYQRKNGGWPKHFNKEKVDYHHTLTAEELNELKSGYETGIDATIDNSATTREIRYLAKAYKRTGDKRYLKAAEKGIEYLLDAQYPNGGWPQYYPDFSSYRSEITYNDNAMINALSVLLDVLEKEKDMEVISTSYSKICAAAVKRGVSCILKTQVKQNGKLTAWCAQYNAKTMKPATARTYELPSLSGQESVGIIRFLMRLPNPDKKIINAVKGGVEWFEKVKIKGYKFIEIKTDKTTAGRDRVLVPEEGSVTWARFYDLKTNEPFFTGRDGKPKKTLAEIELERRIGYAWYNDTPAKLISEEYPKWSGKWIKK
ncbi:MAG: pectate lyase [Ferruginibacter sp.]